jgi:hypothetical protein
VPFCANGLGGDRGKRHAYSAAGACGRNPAGNGAYAHIFACSTAYCHFALINQSTWHGMPPKYHGSAVFYTKTVPRGHISPVDTRPGRPCGAQYRPVSLYNRHGVTFSKSHAKAMVSGEMAACRLSRLLQRNPAIESPGRVVGTSGSQKTSGSTKNPSQFPPIQ